ncbi:glycan-binding surface protein [Flavitalea sp. BT771]|uniref:glycan-binding surface protein n=1 Tax=Flavitalea sp. BT771 TaxID=3063329 RepID=UPI0026E15BB5|nr:glycan-binding surface protein [Flavitalea sp. BT771]MDO6430304.1 glycan-binding surface protein [Flavitalea sp. BT771]MDV6219556.1 glycan-binding surface protein [Flavitalea sp. BT771]
MYNISYSRCQRLLLACVAALLLFASCKKTGSSGPVLTGVRYYAPSPNDTAMASLTPSGQWVVLEGHNLKDAVQILFDGVPATFNRTLFSDTSAVVQIPTVIPFNSVAAGDLNTIKYVTTGGSATLSFSIVVPPATITNISDEMANPGDSVWISGANFFLISDITFAGASVGSYNVSSDGTSLAFVVPQFSTGGPLSITTKSGTTATPFNVEDFTNGVLCNFDNVFTYQWWSAGLDNSSAKFPGNNGTYAILNTNGPLSNTDGGWWNGGRSINCNGAQWVPVANLNDPLANWALKFEVSVPSAWNGTSIFLAKDGNWKYIARYEPWKVSDNATAPFKTNGWRTVTLPLTQFLTKPTNGKDGTGIMAPDLTTLVGSSGNGSINAYVINDGPGPAATGLNVAIDNFRVVKIK